MIDVAAQQAKFREKRRDQFARHKERYDAAQSLQLVLEEISAKARATGVTDLTATDPLKVRQAALSAEIPGLQQAADNADQTVRSLFDELYAEPDFQKLVGELKGNTPFLLFPVRLETRFCRIRHFSKPVSKDWLIDFSNVPVPDSMRGWGLQTSAEGTSLQIRAPFPRRIAISEAQFNSVIEGGIRSGTLRPANGQWLQRKSDTLELRIRIVPDDINIDSFEENVTPAEIQRGHQFWRRVWKGDKPEDAWDELRSFFSTPRSSWIVRQTRPLNFVDNGPLPPQPQFTEPQLRANSYTQPPLAAALPDFFTAILYRAGQPAHFVRGQLVAPELITGFDPDEPDPTAFQPDADGDLKFPEALRWIFNFDDAEKKGMAITIPLSEADFDAGFDKLVVLGVKVSAGREEGKEVLEQLLQSQLYQEKGTYVLRQGTPTNNFESAKSGYNWPDQEAASYFKATWKGGHVWSELQRTDPFAMPDGLRLTQALGITEDFSRKLPGADAEDTREALAMNRLLYPGTLGYWLRQFFSPPLLEAQLDALQSFFERFVTGRGLLPAIRIGHQPYGILPATAFKFWKSANPQDFTQRLLDLILRKLDPFWDGVKGQVLFAGDGRVTADQLSEDLMRLAGNDPASSRFAQQALFGESHLNFMLRLNFFQYLGLAGGGTLKNPPVVNQFQGQVEPELRGKFWELGDFSAFRFMHLYSKKSQLNGPLIEPLPVSEDRSLQTFPGSPWNYFDWLQQSPIEVLWKEQFQSVPLAAGSPPPIPPQALLYHFARFALRRTALECALRLLETDEKLRLLKSKDVELLTILSDTPSEFTPSTLNDQNLIQRNLKPLVQAFGIQNKFSLVPDRFTYLGQATGSPPKPVKDILDQGTSPAAVALARQRQAISILKTLPTARLERLFCEHMDLCGYRLDAWFNALVLERLSRQRTTDPATHGIYLGAFGYLENVKPGTPANFVEEVEPVFSSQFEPRTACLPLVSIKHLEMSGQVVDKVIADSFVYLGDKPTDDCRLDFAKRKVFVQPQLVPGNQGFMHTPSPDHAATAAILRAGWVSRQADGGNDANTLAVRLDAPRVTDALALIEGIGQGDSLAALLGYQLERKLHDNRLDPLIFKLRRLFPFKTDQAANAFAATTDGMAIIKARQISRADWGGPAISDEERQKMEPLLIDLSAQFDALGDLMLTESVFQTVKGSPARAAAALRTLNASGQVHQPEVVRTPQQGALVTFRTGVIFPGNNFLARWGTTLSPKAASSPRLNNWLAGQLPDPAKMIITASTTGGTPQKLTLAELDLQPVDLLAMFPEPNARTENNHLAWLAESLLRKKLALAPGAAVQVNFASRAVAGANELTIFEVSSLVHHLAKLLAASRLLTPTDFLREGGQGAAPLFNAGAIQQTFVKIVKTERQPEKLATRILQAKTDFESKLGSAAAPEILQAAWSALLDLLAEGAWWQIGNVAVEARRAFDVSQSQLLVQTATQAAASLQRTQTECDALTAQLIAAPVNEKMAVCERLGERLFGKAFRLSPIIQLTNAAVVVQARTADLSKNLDLLSLENWQCQSALVHPVFRIYRQCALLREALAAPTVEQTLSIIQFNSPTALPGYWIGAEMRGASSGADVSQNFGGTLSLAFEIPNNWNPTQILSGLVFDEWTEVLPARETTTGVSLHFNQPDTEPPQVILLAVCPAEGENWRWEYLSETILDTFERAKKRLINFDHLRTNPALAHLLPALAAPLETDNLGPNLDLGLNNTNMPRDARGAAPVVPL